MSQSMGTRHRPPTATLDQLAPTALFAPKKSSRLERQIFNTSVSAWRKEWDRTLIERLFLKGDLEILDIPVGDFRRYFTIIGNVRWMFMSDNMGREAMVNEVRQGIEEVVNGRGMEHEARQEGAKKTMKAEERIAKLGEKDKKTSLIRQARSTRITNAPRSRQEKVILSKKRKILNAMAGSTPRSTLESHGLERFIRHPHPHPLLQP